MGWDGKGIRVKGLKAGRGGIESTSLTSTPIILLADLVTLFSLVKFLTVRPFSHAKCKNNIHQSF